MSSWGNNDNAANTPLWAAASVNVQPTRANVTSLFDNTTIGNWKQTLGDGSERLANVAIGIFGVDSNEADVSNTHTGWVLRKQFEGGRAGRVQNEVLVATNNMIGDSDTAFANTIVTITTQPVSNSAIHGSGNNITFTVAASSSQGFPVTYAWQFYNGSTWAATSTDTVNFTGGTTATLTANAVATTANTWKVRAVATSLDQTVTSANAVITIY